MKKIMFYCQYLTGMGHLVRSREILQELVKNFEVCFVNGGPPVTDFTLPPQAEVVTLPPLWIEGGTLKATGDFTDVELVKSLRKETLLDLFDAYQPDCLITEFFPFGRHKLLFELEPLLNHIKAVASKTKVVCSVRDIVGRTDLAQEEDMICQLVNQYFDLILCHSDPHFQTLEESFSAVKRLNCDINYTGFVSQTLEKVEATKLEKPTILVSVGGGRIGYQLLDTVLDASPILAKYIPHTLQVFTGPFLPEEQFLQLQSKANSQSNVDLQRYTNNLIGYMQQADLSISLTGYNTTMNILQTGVKALVVPIGHYGKDEEQLVRTRKLEKLGIVDVLQEQNLQAKSLANKIVTCLSRPPQAPYYFDLQGAKKSAVFLDNLLSKSTKLTVPNAMIMSAAK